MPEFLAGVLGGYTMSKVVVDTGTYHFKMGRLRISLKVGPGKIGLFYTIDLKIMWEREKFREWKRMLKKLKSAHLKKLNG